MQEEKNVSFERAKVEYNGAPDLYVDYVIVKANGQEVNYYLLNDQRIEKGHGLYIVSTNLKEAVDASVPRSHIGIIDDKANVVIPCNNKTVKVIDGKFLLVVRNEPETDSVKEAILASKDQSATEKMVNANATIKDKVNKEMGSGKFILNDLLSEGTIYSLDGENLLDGKYYSFIGMNDHSFYLATNVNLINLPKLSSIVIGAQVFYGSDNSTLVMRNVGSEAGKATMMVDNGAFGAAITAYLKGLLR